jgi:starch phosphorylase
VADVVNNTRSTRDRLRVVFVPDFNVKNGQWIYPAADLSEQISTAGMEASGTGNMKFALNGALTIGTLDGANIEMRDAVGPENFFLFGLTTPDVTRFKQSGYQPREIIQKDQQLEEVLALIDRGTFSDGDRGLFSDIVESVVEEDPYMVAADFRAYVQCQATVDRAFENQDAWMRTAILNVARMGRFSSDRAIGEYARRIWNVDRVSIPVSSGVR